MMPHFVLSHAELISAQARKKGVATEGDRGFSEWALAGRGIKEPLGGTDDRPSQQWGWWVGGTLGGGPLHFAFWGWFLAYILKKGSCNYNSYTTAADSMKIGKAEAYANNAKRTRREHEASAKRMRSECEANASLWKWAHRYSQWPQ